MKSNLALEVPPHAVTPEAVVEKLQMSLNALKTLWKNWIENADYDELLKLKEKHIVARERSEERSGKKKPPSWRGEFVSHDSLLKTSKLSSEEKAVLERLHKEISIREPVSRLNDEIVKALFKKMAELRTTGTRKGGSENSEPDSGRNPEAERERVVPSLSTGSTERPGEMVAPFSDMEKGIRLLEAQIDTAYLNKYLTHSERSELEEKMLEARKSIGEGDITEEKLAEARVLVEHARETLSTLMQEKKSLKATRHKKKPRSSVAVEKTETPEAAPLQEARPLDLPETPAEEQIGSFPLPAEEGAGEQARAGEGAREKLGADGAIEEPEEPFPVVEKKRRKRSEKKIPIYKKSPTITAPVPALEGNEREDGARSEKSSLIPEKEALKTEVIDPYNLGTKKLRSIREDMEATAKAAAKETPYVIGSNRHKKISETPSFSDSDSVSHQEPVGGGVEQESSGIVPQEAAEKTLAGMSVLPSAGLEGEKREGESSEAPEDTEVMAEENGENAENEEPPAVMFRRGDPSWRPLYSEEGKKEELKQALREILAQVGEKAEILAEHEHKTLEAKKNWEKTVDTRKQHEKNFGGMLLGLFTSEAAKKETMATLRGEEESNWKYHKSMESRAVELRRAFDLLKGRRDEIERDIEEIADKESRPHNLESQGGRTLQDKKDAEKSGEKEGVAPGVREKFATMGFSVDHLDGIEGFAALSEGQQLLVFENLQQLTVGRIQEEAEEKAEQERQESGLWGRMWKSVSRQYQIAKAEKQTAEMVMRGGKSMHGEVLTQLVRGMREQGPEVGLGEDGKTLDIQFASGFEASSHEFQTAKEFNGVANAFARLPYEWSLATATSRERKQYEKGEREYEASRKKLFEALQERSSGKVGSLFAMNDIDRQVQMMQFVQNNPKLEAQLGRFKDPNAWKSILSSVVTERGMYMGAGYLGKTLLVGGLGWAAGPVVSSMMGGFRAGKRAQEELHKREKEARKGIKDESREAKNFVSAESLSQKLAHFMKRTTEEEAGEKAAHLLKTRIDYTREKIEKGLVDFGGSPKERVWHQYDLLQHMSRAEAIVEFYASERNERLEKRDKKAGERLEKLLMALEEGVSAKEKSYVRKQAVKGAAIAAGFAGFGAALSWASELVAERSSIPQREVEPEEAMYEISSILYTDEGASLASFPSSVVEGSPGDWDTVSPQDALEVPPPETTESGPLEEAPTEGSRSWNDAASEAKLSTTDPRPEVALSQDMAEGEIPDASTESLPKSEVGVSAEDIHGENRDVSSEVSSDNQKEEEDFVRQLMQEESASLAEQEEVLSGEEGASEVSRAWNEAASEATLSATDPRPEVALGEGISSHPIGVEDSSVGTGSEGAADEQGLDALVEKISDEPGKEPSAVGSSPVPVESVTAETSAISSEPSLQPLSKDALSSVPAAELPPLSAFPEEAGTPDESSTTKEGGENAVPVPEKEAVASELGDTKAFVREHPEMLEPLKKEIGSYRLNIFQTPETKGVPEYDYARSNLGKIEMGQALESYEYAKPSPLHGSQLQNLSEFREATRKAFMAKLGEREGKGMAMVAAGETVNEYTRRMATIALQLGVKIKGF